MAGMRAMWKGSLTLGVVRVPVRVFKATEDRGFSFHQVHAADGGRIRYRRTCELDGEEVPLSDIRRAVENPVSGESVVIDDEDLASLKVPSTKEVAVESFVPEEQIDPVMLDRSYYVMPDDDPGARNAYVLMMRAMADSGRIGLATWTLRDREHLAIVRPHGDLLVLQVLLWPEEIADPAELAPDSSVKVRDQEANMAASLVESLSGDLDWSSDEDAYTDHYREAVQEVVEAKLSGAELPEEPEAPRAPDVVDLTAVLQASVDQARAARTAQTRSARDTGRPRAAQKQTAKKQTARKQTERKQAGRKTPARGGSSGGSSRRRHT